MLAITDKSLFAYFADNRENFEKTIAFRTETDVMTYGEAWNALSAVIRVFRSLKIGDAKNVAFCVSRAIGTPVVLCALIAVGANVVVLDGDSDRGEHLEGVDFDLPIDVIVQLHGDEWQVEVGGVAHSFKVASDGGEIIDEPQLRIARKNATFTFFTSGSTGKSKAVMLSEYAFVNHAHRQLAEDKADGDVFLYALPVHHVMGVCVLMGNITTATTVFFVGSRNPSHVLEIIEKYKCSRIYNVPTYFYMLIDAQEKEHRDISSLKTGLIAGGTYSQEQFKKIEDKLGITLCSSYGMTEGCTGVACSSYSDVQIVRCRGVGKFIEGVDGIVKSGTGKEAKQGEIGEICFKGYNLMLGYYADGKLELPVDEEGYFHTGDLGLLDCKGNLHVVGRIKDVIIRGGENVAPKRIESVVCMIDGVKNACVVGMPDAKYGEVVCALVESDVLTADDVREKLTGKLQKFEMPEKIKVCQSIPLGATGKPDKTAVKKVFE